MATVPAARSSTRRLDLISIATNRIANAITPDLDPVSANAWRQIGATVKNAKRCFHERCCMKYKNGKTVQITHAKPFGFTTSDGLPESRCRNSVPPDIEAAEPQYP